MMAFAKDMMNSALQLSPTYQIAKTLKKANQGDKKDKKEEKKTSSLATQGFDNRADPSLMNSRYS
jgi:hypothetical protein